MSEDERESLRSEIDVTVSEIIERKSVEQLERENAELRAAIKAAPHDKYCDTVFIHSCERLACTCWKSKIK